MACPIDDIADKVGDNRKSVMLCLKKYEEGGLENALFDAPGNTRQISNRAGGMEIKMVMNFVKQDKQIVHIYNAIQNTMYIVTDDEK